MLTHQEICLFCRLLAFFTAESIYTATINTWLVLPHDMLGSQSRMHDCLMYTDDPVFCIVGIRRAALAIRVWHEMVSGTGLSPALDGRPALNTRSKSQSNTSWGV